MAVNETKFFDQQNSVECGSTLDPIGGQRRYQWPDGSSLSYAHWVTADTPPDTPDMPVTPNGPAVPVDYCVFVSGQNVFGSAGNWDAKVCTEKLGYICQADSTADIVIPDVIMRK